MITKRITRVGEQQYIEAPWLFIGQFSREVL